MIATRHLRAFGESNGMPGRSLSVLLSATLLLFVCVAPVAGQSDATEPTPADSDDIQVVAMNESPELAARLRQALADLPDDYEPRTEHLLADGQPKYINRLVQESSPYLLQHAHNPVNWYPWGEAAFAAAREQQKPVFLSIGYATCHWCHVMERESFENEAIAGLMNEHYIAVKVDREQLPDVDALYMSAVQMISGRGGWPMSSFLDAEGRPFHGGTYYTPTEFTRLLKRIEELWRTEQSVLLGHAKEISAALEQANALSEQAREIGRIEIERATVAAMARFDDLQGGFSEAPKFPQEAVLYYLLEQAQRTGNASVLEAVDFTLAQMAAGGIHDQIGGGFHRYSTDNQWLVPHFEKMLYNQGGLARNYTQAAKLTGNPEHERVARGILDYVLREMSTPEGLFYSATDADSEGEEGTFFVWTPDEIMQVLGEEDGPVAIRLWGVSDAGNFEANNILHRPVALQVVAEEFSLDQAGMQARVSDYARRLREHRDQREHPLRDDKLITAWNALMITALAEASEQFGEPRYAQAATRAAKELWKSAHHGEGQLWRAQYEGKSTIEGKQADYAYLAEALLALYDIDGDPSWLERAEALVDTMLAAFRDEENGGFFMGASAVTGATLATRPKDLYDSSMPSGNAVAMRVLARLARRTDEPGYGEHAEELIKAFSGALATRPGGFYYFLTGASEYLLGESGERQYAGRGVVKASARLRAADQLDVHIDMAPGWHINSDQPVQDYLIPTSLAGLDGKPLVDVTYPEPVMRALGFERTELSLFEGQALIQATLPVGMDVDRDEGNGNGGPEDGDAGVNSGASQGEGAGSGASENEGAGMEAGSGASDGEPGNVSNRRAVTLRLQACSDEICLAPETLTLWVSDNEDAS